jgi:hypothetical protein
MTKWMLYQGIVNAHDVASSVPETLWKLGTHAGSTQGLTDSNPVTGSNPFAKLALSNAVTTLTCTTEQPVNM